MIHTCQTIFSRKSTREKMAYACMESCFGWDPLGKYEHSICGEVDSLDAEVCEVN